MCVPVSTCREGEEEKGEGKEEGKEEERSSPGGERGRGTPYSAAITIRSKFPNPPDSVGFLGLFEPNNQPEEGAHTLKTVRACAHVSVHLFLSIF